MTLASEKARIRRAVGAMRRKVSIGDAEQAGRRAAALLLPLLEASDVKRIGLYAALPDELPTRPLYESARQAGLVLLLPRCLAGNRLEFAPVGSWEELCPGRYGLAEPASGAAAVALTPTDWVVLPGVAFGPAGERVGRGKGYYDRTFAPGVRDPRLVGLGYEFQRLDAVPEGPHDRRVDALVTDRGVYAFEGPATGNATGSGIGRGHG